MPTSPGYLKLAVGLPCSHPRFAPPLLLRMANYTASASVLGLADTPGHQGAVRLSGSGPATSSVRQSGAFPTSGIESAGISLRSPRGGDAATVLDRRGTEEAGKGAH